jgi:Tfp pilus assembly protein PilN
VRELEFLPQEYVRAHFRRRIGFIRSWLLLALGLAMVLWSLQMSAWVRDAQAELSALRSTDSAVEADVAKVRMLRAEAQGYNRRLSLVRDLQTRTSLSEVFSHLAAILPDGVVLEEMAMARAETGTGKRPILRLQGTAAQGAAVTQMLSALEGSALLRAPVLVESKPHAREPPERRSFAVEVNIVPTVSAKER